jgi:ribose-phosphate pyrophosphokinase
MVEIDLDDPRLVFPSMPDGMPNLNLSKMEECADIWRKDVLIHARLTDANSLVRLQLLENCLINKHCDRMFLNLRYISAQRMDRSIGPDYPFTLEVFCETLRQMMFTQIYLHCPHSPVLHALLPNSKYLVHTEQRFFEWALECAIQYNFNNKDNFSVVLPDAGAKQRFASLLADFPLQGEFNVVVCKKKRDLVTGNLLGFEIESGKPNQDCLIIDDLCDGGGTFGGQAEVLRKAGQPNMRICLAVYHGIFSKGYYIPGIDFSYRTDSYLGPPAPLKGHKQYLTDTWCNTKNTELLKELDNICI